MAQIYVSESDVGTDSDSSIDKMPFEFAEIVEPGIKLDTALELSKYQKDIKGSALTQNIGETNKLEFDESSDISDSYAKSKANNPAAGLEKITKVNEDMNELIIEQDKKKMTT